MSFVVYKSSAGSGKTHTLVKEYLKLALSGKYPDEYKRILAITFTNKAAAEMKSRILEALKEIGDGRIINERNFYIKADLINELIIDEVTLANKCSEVFKNMLHHYADVSISTIDKFTHRIIRTFAHDLHIPVNFEVELDQDVLLYSSVDGLLSQTGENDELTKFLIEFTESNADSERAWNIEYELYKFSKKIFDENSIESIKQLKGFSINDFAETRRKLIIKTKTFEASLKKIAEQAVNLIKENGIEPESFAFGKNGIGSYFVNVADLKRDKFYPSSNSIKTVSSGNWIKSKPDPHQKEAIESIQAELEKRYHAIQAILEQEGAAYKINALLLQNINKMALLNEIEKVYDAIKKEKNIIHISEFNKRISEIVSSEPAPFIYERLGERYKHYLIDEFQDTSMLQWQNLLPLIENALAEGEFNMVVGDAKQAIYRWRGGDVEQFYQLPDINNTLGNPLLEGREAIIKRNYKEESLVINRRSKCEIIKFNNAFFQIAKSRLKHPEVYNNHVQEFDESNTGGSVLVEWLPNDRQEEKVEWYAGRVVAIIQLYLSKGLQLKDICVLFRNNKEASLIAEFLIQNNIDVISSESLLLSNSAKVKFIHSVLAILDDTENVIAFTESLNYLVQHKLVGGTLTDYLTNERPDDCLFYLSDILSENGFEINLAHLYTLPLYEQCLSICNLFGLNKPTDAYIHFYLDAVYDYVQRDREHSLRHYLRWWNEKGHRLSVMVPDGMNAVRVMSIHKSKGLEFTAVIIPFADWDMKNQKDAEWISWSAEDKNTPSVQLINLNKSLEETPFAAHLYKEQERTLLDNINLLYVAFTRPREHLYILSNAKERVNSVSAFLKEFISANNPEDEEKQYVEIFPIPQSIQLSEKDKSNNLNQIPISAAHKANWRERINISKSREAFLPKDLLDTISYGNLVHEILSKLKSPDNLPDVLNEMYLEGAIAEEVLSPLTEKLKTFLERPDVRLFFNPAHSFKTEAEILLSNGESIRPDKIIFEPARTVVVDFKTGVHKDKYETQIRHYADALAEMGYTNVEAYLLYTEKEEVVQIML